ncbi:MAG: DUF2061 domain-containing protein [Parvularculaceae bacterium]
MPQPALKTLTYGFMHLVIAVAVAYAVTRNWQAALAVGLLEPLVQTVAYNFHERAWARRFGAKAPVPRFVHVH